MSFKRLSGIVMLTNTVLPLAVVLVLIVTAAVTMQRVQRELSAPIAAVSAAIGETREVLGKGVASVGEVVDNVKVPMKRIERSIATLDNGIQSTTRGVDRALDVVNFPSIYVPVVERTSRSQGRAPDPAYPRAAIEPDPFVRTAATRPLPAQVRAPVATRGLVSDIGGAVKGAAGEVKDKVTGVSVPKPDLNLPDIPLDFKWRQVDLNVGAALKKPFADLFGLFASVGDIMGDLSAITTQLASFGVLTETVSTLREQGGMIISRGLAVLATIGTVVGLVFIVGTLWSALSYALWVHKRIPQALRLIREG